MGSCRLHCLLRHSRIRKYCLAESDWVKESGRVWNRNGQGEGYGIVDVHESGKRICVFYAGEEREFDWEWAGVDGDGSPRYTYREGKHGVVAKGRYVDDRLSRGSTIVRPASEVRPVSESFPTYTADRRRARANRTFDDQMYGETNRQVPQGRAQGNGRVVSMYDNGTFFGDKSQSIHTSDANFGYEEDLRYDAGVPETTLRDRYYNPKS
jgi:hypothetical protein